MRKKQPEPQDETLTKPQQTDNETRSLDLTDEEEIASYVEEAKERLENLARKIPSIAIPEEEEIRKMVILRLKRGQSTREIARRLHTDKRVVNAVASPIPRGRDPDFPIETWEVELSQEIANVPPMIIPDIPDKSPPSQKDVETAPAISPEQTLLLKRLYGRPSATPTVLPLASLQPVTISKLQALAMLDGGMDMDMWVNQRLIPWYLISEKIKRKLNLPDESVINPDEFLKLIDMVITENAAFRKIFSDAQRIMDAINVSHQEVIIR